MIAAVVAYLAVGLAVWAGLRIFFDMREDQVALAAWTILAWPLMVLIIGSDSGWEWFPLTFLAIVVGGGVVVAAGFLA